MDRAKFLNLKGISIITHTLLLFLLKLILPTRHKNKNEVIKGT